MHDQAPEHPRLSPRETQVYDLLVTTDLSVKQIAYRLGISPHTIHDHIKRVYRVCGVHGRLELVMRRAA